MPIFKYCHPARIDDLLLDQTLRISPAVVLNDPFEAHWRVVDPLDGTLILDALNEKQNWGRLLFEIASKNLPAVLSRRLETSIVALLNRIPGRQRFASQLAEGLNRLAHNDSSIGGPLRLLIERFVQNQLDTLGAICFSSTPTSGLMWSHYADDHRGIVLAYDSSHPTFRYDGLANPLGRLKRVAYVERLPTLTLRNIPIREQVYRPAAHFFLHKQFQWAYEREWRLILPLSTADIARKGKDGTELRLKSVPREAITELSPVPWTQGYAA